MWRSDTSANKARPLVSAGSAATRACQPDQHVTVARNDGTGGWSAGVVLVLSGQRLHRGVRSEPVTVPATASARAHRSRYQSSSSSTRKASLGLAAMFANRRGAAVDFGLWSTPNTIASPGRFRYGSAPWRRHSSRRPPAAPAS